MLANLDLAAPELLAGYEGGLVGEVVFAGIGLWLSEVLQEWLPDQQACSGEARGGLSPDWQGTARGQACRWKRVSH